MSRRSTASRLRGVLLRSGLEVADALVGLLPAGPAYGLADYLGDVWWGSAPARRRLVAANLARVCAATGRPTSGPAFRRLVKAAFRAHARYYLEVIRVPRYDPRRIDEILAVEDALDLTALFRDRGVIGVSAHFGNFEPAAIWLTTVGRHWVAPIEQIEPPELFAYLRSRRAARGMGGDIVTSPQAARKAILAVRRGDVVAIAADRDVGSTTVEVRFFGHPARVPDGPAQLAILTGAPVVVATVRRTGQDRFTLAMDRVDWAPSGDRGADVATLAQRITDHLETHIARAPEQWWGSFQPVWLDLQPADVAATHGPVPGSASAGHRHAAADRR